MIVANMATFPAREKVISQVIENLLPQIDTLNLCLNEFKYIPKQFAKYQKINAFIPERDFKDVGKFVVPIANKDYALLVDDDIVYPKDYVIKLSDFYDMYSHLNVVVGCHGVIYSDLFDGNVSSRKVFTFKNALDRPRVVNQLGTGTVFLKGSQMPSLEYMKGSERFVDVRFSRWLYENGVSQICIPRLTGWCSEIDSGPTIFETFTKKWPENVTREVQAIAGYSKLKISVVNSVEL